METGKQLPNGHESRDYMVNVVIRVKDRIGSEARSWTEVTVSPTV